MESGEIEKLKKITRVVGSFPTKIDKSKRLGAKKWRCSQCKKVYTSLVEVSASTYSPCECGSIFFEKGY